jgi:hypothetical protein
MNKATYLIIGSVFLILLIAANSADAFCPEWPSQATRIISSNELANCDCYQLEILRNEIYARHGRIFKRQDLQQYFGSQTWYYPDPSNPNGSRGLNKFEQRNATTILQYEKALGCRSR